MHNTPVYNTLTFLTAYTRLPSSCDFRLRGQNRTPPLVTRVHVHDETPGIGEVTAEAPTYYAPAGTLTPLQSLEAAQILPATGLCVHGAYALARALHTPSLPASNTNHGRRELAETFLATLNPPAPFDPSIRTRQRPVPTRLLYPHPNGNPVRMLRPMVT